MIIQLRAAASRSHDPRKAKESHVALDPHQSVVAAEVRVGEVYLHGNLVLPDNALAQQYLERAACQGSPSAAALIGELIVGRPQDLFEAYA